MTNNTGLTGNILIVDDVSKNIQVAGNILREGNYSISFAESGPTALELVKKKPFDLILLDIMMPEMDGFEVCKYLKQNPATQEIPVIFLSAKNDTESIVQAFKTGAVDYVSKPFKTAELLSRVKNHLALRQVTHELELLKKDFEQRVEEEVKKRLEFSFAALGIQNKH